MPGKLHTRFEEDGVHGQDQIAEGLEEVSAAQPVRASAEGIPHRKRRKINPPGDGEAAIASRHSTKIVTFSENENNGLANGTSHWHTSRGTNAKQARSVAVSKDCFSLKRRAQELLPLRQSLPIFSESEAIQSSLRCEGQNALLLVGETGSGKSTQVPQILCDEPWAQRKALNIDGKSTKVGGCIAITEPRRVAAISLARRVAEEVGTPLGSSSPASQVGYSVRFDKSTSPNTRIKFLTEGMLLQEMLRDPWLLEYSAVLVDEVHERGVNVDMVLGFLKKMLNGDNEGRGGIPLKVVVMSATADMDAVQAFLESRDQNMRDEKHEPGNSNGHMEHQDASDSDSEWSGFSDFELDQGEDMPNSDMGASSLTKVITCHIKGRQYPVQIIYAPSPVSDFIDAALTTIFTIHTREPLPGDILVFLTGQETVENLQVLCHQYSATLPANVPKLLILPLFAALPQSAQQVVFQPTPKGRRKIILSTNIAETSVTVPGIRYVIDCGKHKRKQFRSRLSLDSLLVKPISKSSARQRAGRAGREAPGTCYRLYTENDYLQLDQDTSPEILRCDLSQAILTLKARGVVDILDFPLLTPPPRGSLEKALLALLQLSALDPTTGKITDLGHLLARLPLPPRLGRVLLASASATRSVVYEAIDIISALSVESVFLSTSSEEATEAATAARRELFRREGDHLTLLAIVQAYVHENSDRKAWCEQRFISHRAMQAVMDVRKQLTAHAQTSGLLPPLSATSQDETFTEEAKSSQILKAFLTAFHPSTARLVPDGSYRTITGNQTVAIHPSSTLFGRGKVEAIMYNEFVFTNKAYARGVSAVQLDWIGEVIGGGV